MDWIAFIKQNEDEALLQLYREQREACLAWLHGQYSLSPNEAVEVFQDAVVTLYDNVVLGKLTQLTAGIKTYLYAIAKNKVRERQRKKNRVAYVGEDTYRLDSSVEMYDDEQDEQAGAIARAQAALVKLGDPCKSILQLFYYQELNMAGIAERLGYKNTDTVKNQKYKCLKRLQKLY